MKHIKIFSVFCASLLTISFCHGEGISWYKNSEKMRGHIYQSLSVPAINAMQSIQSKGSYALTTVESMWDKNIFQKKIASIEAEFKNIENNLRSQQKNAVIAIFHKNELDDESTIPFCLDIIDELKKFGQEYMSKPQPDIYHDTTIPANLYAAIIKNLKKDNVDPDSIRIIDRTKDETIKDVVFEDAIAMAPYFNWSVKDGKLAIHKEHPQFYGSIALLPKIITVASNDEEEAMLAHECKHIKEQHSTTCGAIKSCLYRLSNDYNEEQLLNSPEWNKLTEIHEQQAEVFPSLQDAETASRMRKTRAAHHYTGMLYESHYNQLSRIDEMWKQHAWLTKKIR